MISGFAFNTQAAALTQSWGWLGSQWQMIPSFTNTLSQSVMGLFYMYPINQVYNSSIWTMPIFFLGGFLVAIVFQITSQLKRKWLVYSLLLLVLLKGNYYLLLVGMMLYEYKLFSRPFFSHPIVVGLLLVIFGFFGGYPYLYQTSQFSTWYAWLPIWEFTYTSTFYHGISATALVILLINNQWLQRIFSLNLFTYFGARSFSLYLVHIVVILSITSRLFVFFAPRYDYGVAAGISFGISFLIMWGLTELLYQLVEKRSSAVVKYLCQRLALKVQ
jgi:peptidoglycan/LPS O-acetylase OafA/YrhL